MTFDLRSEAYISLLRRRKRAKRPAGTWLAVACAAALVACGSSTSEEPSSEGVKAAPAAEKPAATPPETEKTPAEPAPPSGDPSAPEPPQRSQAQSSSSERFGEVDYGDTVWAPGDRGVLMKGLDGGLYEPYLSSVIKQVQQELQPEFYDGPVSGVLDEATMQAIGEFQKQHNLHVSGVPTPYTRTKLFEDGEATST